MNLKLQFALAATIGVVRHIHDRPQYRRIVITDFSVMLDKREEIFGKDIKRLWAYYDNHQRANIYAPPPIPTLYFHQ